MASGMPAAFPGAAGNPLQGAGGSRLGSSGGPPLGRYDSVLDDGLFNSLQVSCAVILLMIPFVLGIQEMHLSPEGCVQIVISNPFSKSLHVIMSCNSNNTEAGSAVWAGMTRLQTCCSKEP